MNEINLPDLVAWANTHLDATDAERTDSDKGIIPPGLVVGDKKTGIVIIRRKDFEMQQAKALDLWDDHWQITPIRRRRVDALAAAEGADHE